MHRVSISPNSNSKNDGIPDFGDHRSSTVASPLQNTKSVRQSVQLKGM
jgi:hypothetical protein